MDASTPLDASQITGLTPASFMFAFRAWAAAESTRFGVEVKQEAAPDGNVAPAKRRRRG